MKFRYVGDNNSPPVKTIVFGYTFELDGNPVEIKDPKVIKKLSGNKCFKEVKPRGSSGKRKKASAEEIGFSVNESGANIRPR